MGVVGGRPRRRRAFGTPIALDARPRAISRKWVSLDGERMAGRRLAHLLEERTGGRVPPAGTRQKGRHDGLVQRAGDVRHGEDGFHGAGEDEAARRKGVVEGPGAGVVPGAEERALPRIPHGEGVIADQVVRTLPAPAPPGPEDEAALGEGGTLGVGNAERAAQRVAVVEAGVRGYRDARVAVEAGGAPRAVPVRGRRRPAAEADGSLRPLRAGLPVVGQRGQHGGQPVRGARIVQVESAERIHREAPFFIRHTARIPASSTARIIGISGVPADWPAIVTANTTLTVRGANP